MRKLDRVQVDLERIGQLLGEIERRLRSVQRQAATAIKYQELTAILKDLRLVFALEEFGRLSTERNGLNERAEKLQSEAIALSTRIAQLEAATSGADAELLELENSLREVEQDRAEALSSRDVSGSRVRDAKARIVEKTNAKAKTSRPLMAKPTNASPSKMKFGKPRPALKSRNKRATAV